MAISSVDCSTYEQDTSWAKRPEAKVYKRKILVMSGKRDFVCGLANEELCDGSGQTGGGWRLEEGGDLGVICLQGLRDLGCFTVCEIQIYLRRARTSRRNGGRR